MRINRSFPAGLLLLVMLFAIPAGAETTVAASVEWLAYSSDVIAVGKIIKVKSTQGLGSVIYDDCTLRVTELIRSPVSRKEILFTLRRSQQEPSAAVWQRDRAELLVFLTLSRDHGSEKHLNGALVPANGQFPLSLVALAQPQKHLIDIHFNLLKDREEVLRATRHAVQAIRQYLKANPKAEVQRNFLQVTSEDGQNIYLSYYILVPSFMSKESISQNEFFNPGRTKSALGFIHTR
ncbi:MAG: hypothetical protein V4671_15960 [Armatimonadota bacterium]